MREWERDEYDERLGQAGMLIKKLLVTPDDCQLRTVCENWLLDHKNYMPYDPELEVSDAKGYDISKLDGDESKLNF